MFEAFEGDKSLYMILDYFEGGNLEDLIKSRKKGFSVNEIKLIMRVIDIIK